jgi:hypothetical protein
MRFLATLLMLPLLTACYRADPLRPQSNADPVASHKVPAKDKTVKPIPPAVSTPHIPPRFTSEEISGITIEGVAFDSRSHRLVIADQAAGPGSQFIDAAAAANASNGIAAINAGFFTPEGAPLGLVISAGKSSGNWNTASSLGSGVWSEDAAESTAISRREKLGHSTARSMPNLLQAGPLLIENHKPISGLDTLKTSARMMMLWDGGTRWWIGRGSPCSLSDLALALSNSKPAGWKIHHALNLDGGRSADLWVSSTVSGGPVVRRSPWNRPVRNFLILRPRH